MIPSRCFFRAEKMHQNKKQKTLPVYVKCNIEIDSKERRTSVVKVLKLNSIGNLRKLQNNNVQSGKYSVSSKDGLKGNTTPQPPPLKCSDMGSYRPPNTCSYAPLALQIENGPSQQHKR